MASHICPKCGGTDFFMSERNVTTGYMFYTGGTTEKFPVCKTCNEIMTVTQSGGESASDFIFTVVGLIALVVLGFVIYGFLSL